ncbi:MAG: hypothetical protein HGA36_05100, partial [Candidatus Moranbacteria bacterium]|nr:hypothetical protein [Candidatus Moranbacteria bacterium]
MPNKTKPVRLSKLNKDTAIYGVLAAVRTFIEDNPDFEGDIVLHVVSFNEKDLKHADNDHVQRLLFRAMQVRTISFEKV